MSPETLELFLSLALGFAVAGLMSAAYQAIAARPPSFRLLNAEARPAALAAVPFLVFAAPFIIMRNTVRGRRLEGRRFEFVMLATVLAGTWSMMSGTADGAARTGPLISPPRQVKIEMARSPPTRRRVHGNLRA